MSERWAWFKENDMFPLKGDVTYWTTYFQPGPGGCTQVWGNPAAGYPNGRHNGIDLGCATGTAIYACWEGEVVKADYDTGYGRHVRILHPNGNLSLYAHMTKIEVAVGKRVTEGEYLGISLFAAHHWELTAAFEVQSSYGEFGWAAQISRMVVLVGAGVIGAAVALRGHQWRHLSGKDALTGLANRAAFERHASVYKSANGLDLPVAFKVGSGRKPI